MFEKYVHTKEDLEAVEEALGYLERPELDFIFKDRNLIENTLVISFDSKELFIWTKLKAPKLEKLSCTLRGWNAYRIPHKIKIKDDGQRAWNSSIYGEDWWEILPTEFQKAWHYIPKIHGGLLTPFVEIHKKLRESGERPLDAYTTKESYLATVIHEFGHVYFGKRNLWYYSDNKETTSYMKAALNIYKKGRKYTEIEDVTLRVLSPKGLAEVFAFCTDYTAASLFWSSHKEEIDAYFKNRIGKELVREEKRNLDTADTFIAESHNFAAVFGRILLQRYPTDWPTKIIEAGVSKLM